MTHYDPHLKDKFPGVNSTSGIVLNSSFEKWANHIIEHLKTRDDGGDAEYKSDPCKRLLAVCEDHAKRFRRPISAPLIVALTHPFYLHLSHWNEIKGRKNVIGVKEYLNTLLHFLQSYPDRSKVSIVTFETVHHYAAATSLLLEQRLIDRVIFTQYDCGYPLRMDGLRDFRKKNFYWGGGYNGLCLENSIDRMSSLVPEEKMFGISDLVLNSPFDSGLITKPNIIHGINDHRVITLDSVMREINC